MKAHSLIVKLHRIAAAVFLLTIPVGWYFSSAGGTGEEVHPLVFTPFVPGFVLLVTGTYQLVRPWVLRRRSGEGA